MSDNRNTLKNRFENFEPEVDETVIDKNWQTLSNKLLTEKETKKGFGYWFGISLIVILLGLSAVITTYTFGDKTTSSVSSKEKSNNNLNDSSAIKPLTEIENEINHKAISSNNKQLKEDSDKSDILNKSNISEINGSNTHISDVTNIASDNSNYNKHTITSADKSSLANNTGIEKSKVTQTKEVVNGSSDSGLLNHSNQNLANESIKETEKDKFNSKYTKLSNPEQSQLQNSSITIKNEFTPLTSIPVFFNDSIQINEITSSIISSYTAAPTSNTTENKKHNFSLDISGGTALNQNTITQKFSGNSAVLNSKNINFSAGIGFNYHVSKKITTSIDYNYVSNNFNNSLTDNKNIGFNRYERNYKNVGDTTFKKDVIEKQFRYNQSYNLASNQSHLIGLGLSYNLFNQSKWNIIPGITVHLKVNRFEYSKQALLNTKDTIIISSVNQPSSDTSSYTTFNSYSTADYSVIDFKVKNDFKTSIGITPNVMFSYSINNRLNLFIKTSYYLDLSSNKIINNELENRIKQNILFAHFGVRLRL